MCGAVVCLAWINIEKFERAKNQVWLPRLLEVSIVCFDELDQFRCAFNWEAFVIAISEYVWRICSLFLFSVYFWQTWNSSWCCVCAVLVSSRSAGRNPFRPGYVMRDPRPDHEAWSPPEPDRTTQVPNCKTTGQSCQSSDDCCFCSTEGGYYSCMICSSYNHKCFI